MIDVHPSAVVHPKAELDEGVTVGPFVVIGTGVKIGRGTKIGAYCVIEGPTQIGVDCLIYPHVCLGHAPQDLKYNGEETELIIGEGNQIREFATLHRATVRGGGKTIVGNHNLLMVNTHVAHDCKVGNHVVMANGATLGGHVVVCDYVLMGGLVGVHQFVRIGAHAMIGGGAILTQDAPPYVNVAGNRARMYGLNLIGLKRHGFDAPTLTALKGAYRQLFRSTGLTLPERTRQTRAKWGKIPEVEALVAFVEQSERGICQGRWDKKGGLLA